MNNFRVNNILKLQRTKGTKIASMILAPWISDLIVY
jgi:hypothetical protein